MGTPDWLGGYNALWLIGGGGVKCPMSDWLRGYNALWLIGWGLTMPHS